jgi:hypothetical protein
MEEREQLGRLSGWKAGKVWAGLGDKQGKAGEKNKCKR